MLRKLACTSLIACTLMLTACDHPNSNQIGGTVIGAAAGGLLGSQFGGGSGKVLAGLAGAAIGGYVGNRIGSYMDKQDQQNYDRAVADTPVGKEARWRNEKTETTYTVRPVREYRDREHRVCRRYKTTVEIRGKEREAYGVACKDHRGRWRIER